MASVTQTTDHDDPNAPRGFSFDWESESPHDPEVDPAPFSVVYPAEVDAEPDAADIADMLAERDRLEADLDASDFETPFAISVRVKRTRAVLIYFDRASADQAFETLGAEGKDPRWARYERETDDGEDDTATFSDFPPGWSDREWHAGQSAGGSGEDEEADYMAYLDCRNSLSSGPEYLGPGTWSSGRVVKTR